MRKSWISPLAAAAALFFAFGVGWAARGPSLPGASVRSPMAANTLPTTGGETAKQQPAQDVLTMWILDDEGERRMLEVPLVDADALDQRFGTQFRTGIPDNLRRQWQESGFEVRTVQKYAPFWIGEDRPLVVPIEDIQIVPVSRQVF
jgi:hypothetical protein